MSEKDNAQTDYEKSIQQEMQKLAQYKESLKEEFKDKELDDPETMRIAKDTVIDLIPDAALTVRYLLTHAESESIRKDLSKWIMELAMQSHKTHKETDDLEKLLNELTKTNTPNQNTPNTNDEKTIPPT